MSRSTRRRWPALSRHLRQPGAARVVSESVYAYGDDFAIEPLPRPNEASNWTAPSGRYLQRSDAADEARPPGADLEPWRQDPTPAPPGGAFRGGR